MFCVHADPAKHSRSLTRCGKTERSELNAYAYTVLGSCSEQFYGGVRKHFAHAQTVYTGPSPFFWEGPGYDSDEE